MIIGCDIDGVLAHFDAHFLQVLIATSGRQLATTLPYEPPCWDWPQDDLKYTKEEEANAWEHVKKSPTFWQNLPAYPDAGNVVKELIERAMDGDSVYYITNRVGKNPKWQTEKWLYNKGYVLTTHMPTVLVTANKGLSAAALELDCYIDDKPSNCEDVLKHRGLKTKVFLMDRSWNRLFERKYVTRVKSVLEMLEFVSQKEEVTT